MKITLLSVDLKLVHADDPSARGFKILEFNDGLRSGFNGYARLCGPKMISDSVTADYQKLFPDLRVVNANSSGVIKHNDSSRVLLIPRSNAHVLNMGRTYLVTADHMSGVYQPINNDLHIQALSDNKAYQSYMAAQAGMEDLFPKTQILPTDKKEALKHMKPDPACEQYVLKPLSFLGGAGIRLIKPADLEKDITRYMTVHKWVGKNRNWLGLWEPSCILQDRIAVNEVETEDGVFDGTMRVAFSVYGDDYNMRCHIHDAYWKLPSCTIEEGKGADSVISFSPSNIEKLKPKQVQNIFDSMFSQAVALSPIKSAPVKADVKSWLFPQLKDNLSHYFTSVHASDHFDSTVSLLNSDSMGEQGLGVMMATHPAFYPAAKGESVDMHYPFSLVDALIESKVMEQGMGHVFKKLSRIVGDFEGAMQCEDPRHEFAKPLKAAIENARTLSVANMVHFVVNELR